VIAQVAAVLLPVFCIAGLGYVWRLSGVPFDLPFVTRVIMYVAGPCLVFDSLSKLTLPLAEFGAMVGATIALTLGNTGNLGLPLCLFAFGEEGLGLAVGVYVTNSVLQFTFVPLLQARVSIVRTVLTTPIIYGLLAGLGVLFTGVHVPVWLADTTSTLGGVLIPLMLMALGHTIGGLRAHNLPRAFGLGTARLVIAFVVAVGVSKLLGLTGVARGVLVLQGAMPAAVFSYLFAARYERDADDIAGIVLVSTLLGALLLPFLVSYALWLSH